VATRGIDVDLQPLRYAGATVLGAAAAGRLLGTPDVGCPLRSLTGVPCPFCGTSRGVIDLVHGDLGGALLMNPASVLLVVAVVVLLVTWSRRRVRIPAWSAAMAIAALWGFQLFKLLAGQPL
jgi:hypothetical protein